MRTKARIKYKKLERIQRQTQQRIRETLSAHHRQVLELSRQGYDVEEIARELALPREYISHFMNGLLQRLIRAGLLSSGDWRGALGWAEQHRILKTDK